MRDTESAAKRRSWNIIPEEQDHCNTQVPNNLPASEGSDKHPGVISMDFVFLAVILLSILTHRVKIILILLMTKFGQRYQGMCKMT